MSPRAEALLPIKKQAQKRRFEKERKYAFHGQGLSDHPSSKAGEVRPVGAKLKFQWNTGHHSQQKVNAENFRPETRRLMVSLIVAPKAKGLQNQDQRRQPHRELRKEIVECNGECEVDAMNQKSTIHKQSRGRRSAGG